MQSELRSEIVITTLDQGLSLAENMMVMATKGLRTGVLHRGTTSIMK